MIQKIITTMMTNQEIIYEHALNIEKRMRKIPDLIDTKKDKQIWDLMSTCNDILLELVDLEFVTTRELILLSNEYKEILTYLEVITEPAKYFLINLYFVIIMEYMVEYCEDKELFEACSNIKRFEKLL